MPQRVFLLLVYLIIQQFVVAQSRYRFYTLDVEQGLTSNTVWSICKDRYNYVWIATQNGLNRYDGHQIRQYLHNPQDSFSIPSNVVYWIYKDVQGELWFVFGGKGLMKYNYKNDRFERFEPYDSIIKKNKYRMKLWRIGNDQQGRIYFANGSSCFRYSLAEKSMQDLTPFFKGALEGHDIGMFVPQYKEYLWITTNNGLFRYHIRTNEMQHFPFDAHKYGLGEPNMHDAEFIDEHTLLVAVSRTGFVLFDTRTYSYSLPPAPVDPTRTRLLSGTGSVLKDRNGRIWIANSRYGLLEYFPQSRTIYSMKKESSYPYPHPEQEGEGLNVYEDPDGNIWYGSSRKGVIWFKPESDFVQVFQRNYATVNSIPDELVTNFLSIGQNKLLIATNGGLAEYNKADNTFRRFPVSFNDQETYPHPAIRSMIDMGSSVFLSTRRGLSVYNKKNGSFSRFLDPSPVTDSVFPYGQWLIHGISPSEIVVSGQHLARFNPASGKYRYNEASRPDALYSFSDINASWYDKRHHTLWLESEAGKLYSYDVSSNIKKAHPYTTDSVHMIHAIVPDETGRLFLGTTNGLFYYDPVSGKGQRIPLGDSESYINNVAIQNQDYLWFSTLREVFRYNRKSNKMEVLSLQKLMPNSAVTTRAFMFEDGLLWVGTNKGFCTIQVDRFLPGSGESSPSLVSFAVFDKEKSFDAPIHELKKIVLKHNENFFSFNISSFNYTGRDQYSYKLEGFDKDWQRVRSNTGSYTNVPPGKYQLRLRSSNESGTWTENPGPITLIVLPSFWQTWWFIALLGAIVLAGLLFYYRIRQKQKSKQQIDRTIDYFANSLYGENSVNEVCWDIARNCISQLNLEDCVVYLFDEQRNVLVQKAAYGPKNPKDHIIINPIEIEPGKGIVGTAAQTGKPVLVKNTRKDDRYIVDDVPRLSELAVPIIHEGQTIGVIDSEHSKKNFFTKDHVKALSTIAAISANKIAETKAEAIARQREVQLLEINKLLAESQLMALRAQMNPHFVFNCLNSIQECIVTQKYGEASLYLNKFSKLFRSVLSNSGRVMITLAEEIEVLELYLSLEHMRFEKSFSYTIEVEEDMEIDEIMIPSMLLQPYVENALWHGLMHKESDRELNIAFRKIDEDIFQCVVEDNGIGRKKALQLKEQQNKGRSHVSKGMSISKERIDLLRMQEQHASLAIIDKYDAAGEPTGTKIVIELSTYLKP